MKKSFNELIKVKGKKLFLAAALGLSAITFCGGMVLGADVSQWISVYRNTVSLEVNQTKITTDNFLYNNVTYVPLRAVAQMLGKEVGWNAQTKVARIDDVSYQKAALAALLPSAIGYQWKYDGFAEYSHEMQLNSVTDEAAKRTYGISGRVGDPSGGESTADFTIDLQYILEGTSLIQQKQEQIMMDSKFNRLTLIKTPLEAGNFWTEEVTDKTGMITEINGQIMKIETLTGGVKQYTVRYQDHSSAYFEQRVIRQGAGVVSFEKLFELGGEPFSAGYFLYMPVLGK